MTVAALTLLTPRERDCLRLVGRGLQTKEIAVALGLAPDTVDEYIGTARLKLGAANRRIAARQLLAAEGLVLPQSQGEEAMGVEGQPSPTPEPMPTAEQTRPWPLPFRRPGEVNNELGIGPRLLWILLITIGLAIGFGMLTSGLKVVADLFGGSAYLRH